MAKDLKKQVLEETFGGELTEGVGKKKKEEKPKYIGNFDNLVELVEDDGKTKFLTFDGELLSEITIDDQTYYPPEKVDWLLPRASKVLELVANHSDSTDRSDSAPGVCPYCDKLLMRVVEYFRSFSQTPTGFHYLYLALMAFHSNLIEHFNYSPILFLVATKGRGKTPTLKALAYISRRGLFTETFREANLIRWSSDYDASLFFDVRDFPKKVERSASEDLIYGRAERGVVSSRVLFPEKGAFRDMVSFSTFGVTAATSNVMVDAITEARCIVFNMPYSKVIYNVDPTREGGLELKEELTAFRMTHSKTRLKHISKERAGKLENYLKGYQQMVKTFFPNYEKAFLKFKEIVSQDKKEDAENTMEGKILSIIIKLSQMVEKGTSCLLTDLITNVINEGRAERFELSQEVIGKILKGMGFKMKKNSAGTKRGIFYDPDLVESLKEQYGLEDLGDTPGATSVASEPSEDKEDEVQKSFKGLGI